MIGVDNQINQIWRGTMRYVMALHFLMPGLIMSLNSGSTVRRCECDVTVTVL
jgi:hypothetical protein